MGTIRGGGLFVRNYPGGGGLYEGSLFSGGGGGNRINTVVENNPEL